MHIRHICLMLLMISLLSVSCSGCNGYRGSSDTAPASDHTTTRERQSDTTQTKDLSIPEAFPIDILPLMEGAIIKSVSTYETTGYKISYTIDQSLSAVATYYRGIMSGYGGFTVVRDNIYQYAVNARQNDYRLSAAAYTKTGSQEIDVILTAVPVK